MAVNGDVSPAKPKFRLETSRQTWQNRGVKNHLFSSLKRFRFAYFDTNSIHYSSIITPKSADPIL